MTAVSLVQGRGEMAFMPAVTALLLHQIAMGTGKYSSIVNKRLMGNFGNACSYCTTHSFFYKFLAVRYITTSYGNFPPIQN